MPLVSWSCRRLSRLAAAAATSLLLVVASAAPAAAAESQSGGGFGTGMWDGMILTGVVGVFIGIAVMFSLDGTHSEHDEEEA